MFDCCSWIWVARDILLVVFTRDDMVDRVIAVNALAQLCLITEETFLKNTISVFEVRMFTLISFSRLFLMKMKIVRRQQLVSFVCVLFNPIFSYKTHLFLVMMC